MSENLKPIGPVEYLMSKYLDTPELWAIQFNQKAWKNRRPPFGGYEDTDNLEADGIIDPLSDVSYSKLIYRESAQLIRDSQISKSVYDALQVGHDLEQRMRIVNGDSYQFRVLGPGDFGKVTDRIRENAVAKLECLADLLIHEGRIEAVPLALLTGHAEDVLDEEFAEKFPSHDRYRVLKTAEQIWIDGGTIFLPERSNPLSGVQVTLIPGNEENYLGNIQTKIPEGVKIPISQRIGADWFAGSLLTPRSIYSQE